MPGKFFIGRNAVLLPQVDFFRVVGLLFAQRNCHKLDLPTRKCVKIFKKKAKKCQIFSIRNYPKIPKKCIYWVQKFKIFPGEGPGPPTHWQALPAFLPAGRNSCGEPCSYYYFFFLLSLSFDFFFSFFSSPLCVCQECACAKSLIVHNQELDVTLPVPGVRLTPDVRKTASGCRRWRLLLELQRMF